jgi:hypothetical protein
VLAPRGSRAPPDRTRDEWGIEIGVDEPNHREWDTTGWQYYYTEDDIAALMLNHKLHNHSYQCLYFTGSEEIATIRKIDGNQIATSRLIKYPLFVHLVVANKR